MGAPALREGLGRAAGACWPNEALARRVPKVPAPPTDEAGPLPKDPAARPEPEPEPKADPLPKLEPAEDGLLWEDPPVERVWDPKTWPP